MKLLFHIKKYFSLKTGCIFLFISVLNLMGQAVEIDLENPTQQPDIITFIVGESTIVKAP